MFNGKIKLDKYFLTEACPYSKKRQLNKKSLGVAGGGLTALFLFSILFFGGKAEQRANQASADSFKVTERMAEATAKANVNAASSETRGLDYPSYSNRGGGNKSSRNYTASQIVMKSPGRASVDGLPMGSTFTAKLVNTVLSSDSEAPVIAEVTDDVTPKDSLLIPRGTRAIGSASFDETAQRLKVRFHTLVYPEGDQHSISGLGLLQDGSSGLLGVYHSKAFQKQAGRFIGNFVSGFANGMMERTAVKDSMPYEPGSLKNGILNGVSSSTADQAKQYSDDMQNVRGYLEVPAGTTFLIYLQKEFAQ
jgi:type IV secretory pathway VirB10-like protein